MNKKLSLGDEVLRFPKREYRGENELVPYVVCRIISSRQSEDLSYHGSPWYEEVYQVMGEDGNIYTGTYGSAIVGNSYFLTREDYIQYLLFIQKQNREKIQEIRKFNTEIQGVVHQLQPTLKKTQYVKKKA